jgi:ParB family chromosome partitioning protein
VSTERPTKGLGMGLQALLGETARRPDAGGGASGVREVEVARIRPNPNQPRVDFDEEALGELATSIREHGILQPILLRPDGDGYLIVAGERRWRAAQKAGKHSVPALIRDLGDAQLAEIALIENIQREDLNPIEEAEGYRQLIERHGHSQEGLGAIVHKSRSHIANLLRLLSLPASVRDSLLQGDISMGHARAVATSPDPEALTREIIAKGWSVRQAEAAARKIKHPKGKADRSEDGPRVDADLTALERQLGDILGLKVQVSHRSDGGTVTLNYSTLDQLDMICQRLSGEPI